MSFLLVKIASLMIAAAFLDGWLARWWMRRYDEDVTSEYARLRANWAQLAHRAPVDLTPVHTRLARLEDAIHTIKMPEISAPKDVDLSPLHARVGQLEQAVRDIPVPAPVDMSAVNERLERLEIAVRGISIPPPTAPIDLTPVLKKLEGFEQRSVKPPPGAAPSIRAGSRNLLSHAAYGRADDLKLIKGVKRVMEHMLLDIGVYYFWQIAEWTPNDIAHADAQLPAFHGRIQRDDWVRQAQEFCRRVDAAQRPGGEPPTSEPPLEIGTAG